MLYHHQYIQIYTCTEMIPHHLNSWRQENIREKPWCIRQHLTEIEKNFIEKTILRIGLYVLLVAAFSPFFFLSACLLFILLVPFTTHIIYRFSQA